MAEGEVNAPILAHTKDEIGDLAQVLESIRIILKTAKERLARM
jgi:HAMP domain-containing protein